MRIQTESERRTTYEMSFQEFAAALWGSVDGDGLPEDGEGVTVDEIVLDREAGFVTIELLQSDGSEREV